MRSKLNILVVVVILAVAAGVLQSTGASGKSVLHLVVGPQDDVKVALDDTNFDGLRLGDRIAGRGPLLDESQTDRLGTSYAHCIVNRRIFDPDKGLWNCNYVLDLEDGEVMLQGLDPRGPGVYEMAVIGGTGIYAGATGDATFTDVGSDGDAYTDMVIRLN